MIKKIKKIYRYWKELEKNIEDLNPFKHMLQRENFMYRKFLVWLLKVVSRFENKLWKHLYVCNKIKRK